MQMILSDLAWWLISFAALGVQLEPVSAEWKQEGNPQLLKEYSGKWGHGGQCPEQAWSRVTQHFDEA